MEPLESLERGVQSDVMGNGLVEMWEQSFREWEGAKALWALEQADAKEWKEEGRLAHMVERRPQWEKAAGERAVRAWKRWTEQGSPRAYREP